MKNVSRVVPKISDNYVSGIHYTGDGKYGHAFQSEYDKIGVKTNQGEGNDIPEMDLEIKSWDPSKKGDISVSTHTFKDIIASNGECFMDKLQKWNLHRHHEGQQYRIDRIDYKHYQHEIKEELNKLTENYKNNPGCGWTLAQSEHFILEKTKSNTSGKLRIKNNKADKFFNAVNSAKNFKSMFKE